MKKIKRITAFLIAMLMVFALTSPAAFASEDNASWTILIYLCGSDLESDGGYATSDIVEIVNATATADINVLIETGGSNTWDNEVVDASSIERYCYSDGELNFVDSQPSANMGDPETLIDYITWAAENYPAENTGLVFWNHGGGSISGVCFDELYDYNSLSLKEIESALSATAGLLSDGFEFVGFDACLMATLENACMLMPYAHYMYASEELEPGEGWDYTTIISYLAETPSADGDALGNVQSSSFYNICDANGNSASATFSIIDLSKIPAFVEAFDATAKELYESNSLTVFARSALKADNFGGNNRSEGYTNMIDIADLLRNISDIAPSASTALNALEDAVIYKNNGSQHKNAGGLSMYYPLSIQGTEEISTFTELCPSTYYLAIVDALAEGADLSVSDNEAFNSIEESSDLNVADLYLDEDGIYTVVLEDMDAFAYASCMFFMYDDEDGLYYLGEDDDVLIDYDEYIITDNFDGSWLCLDGSLLPIELVTQTEDISLYTCSILLNGEETNLRIMYDWNEGEFYVLGTWDGIDSDSAFASRETNSIQDGDVINLIYTYIDANGDYDYFISDDIVVDGELDIYYDTLPDGDYDYSIVLYDIYGNYYMLDYTTFNVEDGEVYFYE